jgi:hypothetical protein
MAGSDSSQNNSRNVNYGSKEKYFARSPAYETYVRGGGLKSYQDWSAQNRSNELNKQAESILSTGKPTGSILSGSEKEKRGQLAGLNLGAMSYGQGLKQTGQDVQGVINLLKGRVGQGAGDPMSAAIMSQKAGAEANARRNMIAGGARGSAISGSLEAIGRQQNQQIAQSLYGQQRQSLADLRSVLGNIISGTTSLMQGEKALNVSQPQMPEQQQGFLSNLLGGLV